MLPLTTSTIVIQLQQFRYYVSLCTVQVHSEFKIKILDQNQVYCEDLRLLTLKTKFGTTMYFPEDLENTPFTRLSPKYPSNINGGSSDSGHTNTIPKKSGTKILQGKFKLSTIHDVLYLALEKSPEGKLKLSPHLRAGLVHQYVK